MRKLLVLCIVVLAFLVLMMLRDAAGGGHRPRGRQPIGVGRVRQEKEKKLNAAPDKTRVENREEIPVEGAREGKEERHEVREEVVGQ